MLRLKMASTSAEVLAAQRLRYQVFNVEMHAGLAASKTKGLDRDPFDAFCRHILVIDEKIEKVIGTYRMLTRADARKAGRFYSEGEFDLTDVKKLKGGLLEVGRSCIHKEYRRKSALYLLWQGIAQYAKENRVRYVFGCASIFTTDPREASEIYLALKFLGYFSPVPLKPLAGSHALAIRQDLKVKDAKEIFQHLPPLFKAYLALGLKVCGTPVVDRHFKTTDFFVLLDIKNMNPSYRRRLFRNYLSR